MDPVVWWVVFRADGYVFAQPVEWLVKPAMKPDAYAAQRLWELSAGYDPAIPAPPAGPVQCAIHDGDPTIGVRSIRLGQAERMFRPGDAVRQDV